MINKKNKKNNTNIFKNKFINYILSGAMLLGVFLVSMYIGEKKYTNIYNEKKMCLKINDELFEENPKIHTKFGILEKNTLINLGKYSEYTTEDDIVATKYILRDNQLLLLQDVCKKTK